MAHHAHALREEGANEDELAAICRNPRTAPLALRERALVDYAVKLTRLEAPMCPKDLEPLRHAGLSDADIRDAAQVVGYFNYVNRHVEGLGVELEPEHPGRRWAELALTTSC